MTNLVLLEMLFGLSMISVTAVLLVTFMDWRERLLR